MQVVETIKNNPWKTLVGSAGTIITVVTALFTLDARYAHAAEVEKQKTETQVQIQRSVQLLRKQTLEDKVFELDIRKSQTTNGKLPPVEEALHERYKRQLKEIKAD
jgi:hypothetical protein